MSHPSPIQFKNGCFSDQSSSHILSVLEKVTVEETEGTRVWSFLSFSSTSPLFNPSIFLHLTPVRRRRGSKDLGFMKRQNDPNSSSIFCMFSSMLLYVPLLDSTEFVSPPKITIIPLVIKEMYTPVTDGATPYSRSLDLEI